MNSRLTMIGAGILTIISAWLPWIKLMGMTQNGFMGDYKGNPGIIFIATGIIIAVMGLVNKKWSAIIAILFSACVCALGFKYYGDGTSGDAVTVGASIGYGVYVMIVAGLMGIAGGIMRFLVKKNAIA
jgi:hypothetical protein